MTDTITQQMKDFFNERTSQHISRVQKYAKSIEEYDPVKFKGLVTQAKHHDDSKWEEPEYSPYLFITWEYKCKDDGTKFIVSDGMRERMSKATEHHVKNPNNRHHPESGSRTKTDLINRENRDKPIKGRTIDAKHMNNVDIGELVADWLSMGEEKGTSTKKWADDNIGKRWDFSVDQKNTIYDLIDNIKVDKKG